MVFIRFLHIVFFFPCTGVPGNYFASECSKDAWRFLQSNYFYLCGISTTKSVFRVICHTVVRSESVELDRGHHTLSTLYFMFNIILYDSHTIGVHILYLSLYASGVNDIINECFTTFLLLIFVSCKKIWKREISQIGSYWFTPDSPAYSYIEIKCALMRRLSFKKKKTYFRYLNACTRIANIYAHKWSEDQSRVSEMWIKRTILFEIKIFCLNIIVKSNLITRPLSKWPKIIEPMCPVLPAPFYQCFHSDVIYSVVITPSL